MQDKYVECPTCGAKVKWGPQSKWRPFCSERCRLIDLGEWFDEKKRLPEEERPPGEPDEESLD